MNDLREVTGNNFCLFLILYLGALYNDKHPNSILFILIIP